MLIDVYKSFMRHGADGLGRVSIESASFQVFYRLDSTVVRQENRNTECVFPPRVAVCGTAYVCGSQDMLGCFEPHDETYAQI